MYDVAIVGAGPTGAVAANLCGVYGLSAVAFDREAEVYDLPRAVGMWDDVQRILGNAGVFEAVLPATCLHSGAEFVDSKGNRISGLEIPGELLSPNGYPFIRGVHQPTLERAVRSCLDRYENVALQVSHEVTAVDQNEECVSLVVRDRGSGTTKTIRARWLIACDGASSPIRKSCGIAWESLGYDCEWLVVDVSLKRDANLPPLMTQVCDPARPTTIIPLPLRMHRWEFQLLEGETKQQMEAPERVWSLLEPWLTPADADIVRAVVYRFHATIAATFRDRRIFLAGDAAHQTPPFMGQGMCSGIRDVDNLIWKIQHVTRGFAGDLLLDTYTDERRPLVVAAVEHSVNIGKLIDAYAAMERGGPAPSPALQEYAYGGSAQLPHLSAGLLAREANKWIGRLVPQCDVATPQGPRRLDAVVGPHWAILSTRDPRESMGETTRRRWEQLGTVFVTLPEPDGRILPLLLAHDTVVRPDRIIFSTSVDAIDQLPPAV